MKLLELIETRFSHRGYEERKIEREKIDYILKCSRLAPSAANKQPWKIYIVEDPKTREAVCEAYNKTWMNEAPVIIVFTGTRGQNWLRRDGLDYLMCDITIIADYFILAATEMGLGTCYIAAFDESRVIKALNLPANEKPFLLTPLGYAREGSTKDRKRKSTEEIVRRI